MIRSSRKVKEVSIIGGGNDHVAMLEAEAQVLRLEVARLRKERNDCKTARMLPPDDAGSKETLDRLRQSLQHEQEAHRLTANHNSNLHKQLREANLRILELEGALADEKSQHADCRASLDKATKESQARLALITTQVQTDPETGEVAKGVIVELAQARDDAVDEVKVLTKDLQEESAVHEKEQERIKRRWPFGAQLEYKGPSVLAPWVMGIETSAYKHKGFLYTNTIWDAAMVKALIAPTLRLTDDERHELEAAIDKIFYDDILAARQVNWARGRVDIFHFFQLSHWATEGKPLLDAPAAGGLPLRGSEEVWPQRDTNTSDELLEKRLIEDRRYQVMATAINALLNLRSLRKKTGKNEVRFARVPYTGLQQIAEMLIADAWYCKDYSPMPALVDMMPATRIRVELHNMLFGSGVGSINHTIFVRDVSEKVIPLLVDLYKMHFSGLPSDGISVFLKKLLCYLFGLFGVSWGQRNWILRFAERPRDLVLAVAAVPTSDVDVCGSQGDYIRAVPPSDSLTVRYVDTPEPAYAKSYLQMQPE